MVLKEHIVLGCLNDNDCLPIRPPHHVGYDLKSWIPSVLCLKYFSVFIAFREKKIIFFICGFQSFYEGFPVCSSCSVSSANAHVLASCVLGILDSLSSPAIPLSMHLPRMFFSLLLPSPNSYWNFQAQIGNHFICGAFLGPSGQLIILSSTMAVIHTLLVGHSMDTCLPHYNVVICRSVPDRISFCLSISTRRSVVITWLS